MLRLRAPRLSLAVGKRYNLNLPLLFIANNQTNIFQGEKLSPEENDAAIPTKPIFFNDKKVYQYVINPEQIADLITKATPNDILVSILSENCALLGDKNHHVITKETGEKITVHTLFAYLTWFWLDIFNKQIKPLGDLQPGSHLTFENKTIDKLILNKFPKIENFKGELSTIYETLNAFKNSDDLQSGLLTPAEVSRTITVDNLSLYLLKLSLINENPTYFKELVGLISHNIHYFSPQTLKLLLITLIDNLYLSSLNTSPSKLKSFSQFIVDSAVIPSAISQLDNVTLDKLAFLVTISGNFDLAKTILEVLVLQNSTAPSPETFDAFLLGYAKSVSDTTRLVRDLSNLKSVFFHRQLSPISFNILLETVNDVNDFNQFLNLIEANDKHNKLFTQFQTCLFEKLISVQHDTTLSSLEKLLQITQLVHRIVSSKEIKLNAKTIQLLGDFYLEVGNTSNIEVLCLLNK